MNKIHVYLSLIGKRFHIVSGIAVLFSSIIVSTVFGSFLPQKTALLYPSLGPVHEDKASIDWDEGRKVQIQKGYGTLPLFFIQNNGQMDERVRFYERGGGHTTFLTERGVCLSLVGSQQSAISSQEKDRHQKAAVRNQKSGKTDASEIIRDWPQQPLKPLAPKSQLIKLIPLGSNKNAKIVAEGKLEGMVNYFIGNDHKKWKTGIPTYSAVVYKDLYKDIDMRVYGNNHHLEYDIVVKPGASPSRVQLLYQGTEGLRITEGGDLEISLNDGSLIQKKPYIYQEIDGKRVKVAGKFKIRKGERHSGKRNEEAVLGNASPVLNSRERARNDSSTKLTTRNSKHFVCSFQVASYDKRYPLVIDPILVYSTYLGGSDYDYSYSIAVDSAGNAYVTGNTYSEDFPTASALYGSNRGGGDVFVTKLDASGSSMVYSTYLGGSFHDCSRGITVDTAGNAYVVGYTYSEDFPTASALFGNNRGGGDVFVTKLGASGNSLVYSTYLGGSSWDFGIGIAIDTSGNAYVTGETASTDFPTASALFGNNAEYDTDAFIAKFDATGSNLIYSTYLGGSKGDSGFGIAVDTAGNAYVTGNTYSEDFPTASALFGNNTGSSDVFVTKLDAFGNSLVYSTYLGGSLRDSGRGLGVDTAGNVYITGYTYSTDFPTASALFKHNRGGGDAFIAKLDASGNNLVYSTYLGGNNWDSGAGIAVDTAGNAYVTGETTSTDFPTASALFENNTEYDTDAFITKLDASGSLIYSSYLGGSDVDSGLDIAVDISGNAYVSGYTFSDDFPTASPLFGSHRELSDVFVTKIKYDLQAHYTFDEGSGTITVDSFGNGNDGTIHGAAWTTGKSGGGLYFDGIDDYVTIPRMNNDEVSIAAWFYKNAYDDLRSVTIFGGRRWNPDVQLREGFSLKFYANNPHILEFILLTQDGNGNRTQRSAGFDLSDSVGNWYHVAGTYNKTTGAQMLYVNGQLVDTRKHPAGNTVVPLTFYSDMKIGSNAGLNGYFNGIIDDVRIYNRALSDQEIQDIYNEL